MGFKKHMLNKEELDKLSEKEVDNIRGKIIQSHDFYDTTAKQVKPEADQYLNELDIYINVRFKDTVMARYERWDKETDEYEGDKNDTHYKSISLFRNIPNETLYLGTLTTELEKIDEFKYILGIEIPKEVYSEDNIWRKKK
jgi:hypothetical protein